MVQWRMRAAARRLRRSRMGRRAATAFVVGVALALLVAGLPASAADQTINAQVPYGWDQTNVTINVGDTVTWANPGGGDHNVCVAKAGSQTCSASDNQFRNGDPSVTWATYTNSYKFTTPGTYKFLCEVHAVYGMVGTITVNGTGGTTTTTTTGTGTGTTPTYTQTTPTQTQTQTQTQTTPADTTAPVFTGKLKRRASRKSLILDLGSSEDATLTATVFRRAPGKRTFARVGQASLDVHAGRNVVTLPRKASGKLRSGAYRVRLVLTDAAGNHSAPRTLVFKLA
jgi:plastocyanin